MKLISLMGLFLFTNVLIAKTVSYELVVNKQKVNMSGKREVDFALTVNGGIPAPTLEFTEGDDAEITVRNQIPGEEVSLHWHGILLPPEEDGVAYVNTPPIYSGKSHVFRFKIRQHGTYWYHSHTAVQEQKGVYAAFIIHPKKKIIQYDKDVVVVLSDWADEDANRILANLRKDGDYYLYKKDSIRSYEGAIRSGGLVEMFKNEWQRMGGMDLSDVGYDAFLINGKRDSQLAQTAPGEKVRIRIINAAASSYFYVSLGGLPMQVVAADGIDITPVQSKEILIGMAETYDVLFTPPQKKNYELRATVQDVTGYASGWLGAGETVSAATKAQPNLYAAMDHSGGHAKHQMSQHSHHNHAEHGKSEIESLTVDQVMAKEPTAFSTDKKVHDVKLVLGGDMERYVWHINGRAIYQERNIVINEGEVVRFTLVNETMMHHPMHLHGHFFRVINMHQEYSPLKHTVDVPPHGSRTIEFLANEPGEWMLHCHNLYHMKTGMARVVKYSTFTPKPEIARHQKHDPHLHQHLYFNGMIETASNHAQGDFRVSRTWDMVEVHLETREYDNLEHAEADVFYKRWFSNYFSLIAGGVYFAEYARESSRGVLGVGYVLPMLIDIHLLVDHTGEVRLDLERKFQWTKNIYSDVELAFRQDEDLEFEISLMYAQSWEWAAGLMLTEDSVGAGFQYKF